MRKLSSIEKGITYGECKAEFSAVTTHECRSLPIYEISGCIITGADLGI